MCQDIDYDICCIRVTLTDQQNKSRGIWRRLGDVDFIRRRIRVNSTEYDVDYEWHRLVNGIPRFHMNVTSAEWHHATPFDAAQPLSDVCNKRLTSTAFIWRRLRIRRQMHMTPTTYDVVCIWLGLHACIWCRQLVTSIAWDVNYMHVRSASCMKILHACKICMQCMKILHA